MISDAEMVTLAVMQALLGHTSEARWLRFADEHLRHLFPYLPKQPGYNKRLRRLAATLNWLLGALARDTSVWTDDVWVVDSTPVECARSRETAAACPRCRGFRPRPCGSRRPVGCYLRGCAGSSPRLGETKTPPPDPKIGGDVRRAVGFPSRRLQGLNAASPGTTDVAQHGGGWSRALVGECQRRWAARTASASWIALGVRGRQQS